MVERKSGPVKPPTLDLKARENAQKDEKGNAETPDESTPTQAADKSEDAGSGSARGEKASDSAQGSPASSVGSGSSTSGSGPSARSESGTSSAASAKPGSATASSSGAGSAKGPSGSQDSRAKDQKAGSPSGSGSSSAKGGTSGGGKAGETAHAAAPQPPLRPHSGPSSSTVLATGVGGAVLGAILAYGIAALGYWPGPPDRTDALMQRIDELEQSVSTAASGFEELDARVETVTGELEGRIASAEDRVASLSEDTGPSEAVAQLSQDVSALQNQVSALDSGASSEQAQQIASALSEVQARAETLDQGQQGLEQRITELESALANQPDVEDLAAERDRFARWPAALDALETRIDAGAPFAQELSELSQIAPDLSIPEAVTRTAGQGVPALEAIQARFADLIPEILAARPRNPNAPWYQNLLDQAGAALALRPVGDSGGTGPDAQVARAEAALESGNPGAARDALAALPDPMAERAHPVIGMLDARIAAESFLETAREQGAASSQASEEPAA